jgi:hypothetical protein
MADRPTEKITLSSGLVVTLYSYLTVKEKRELAKAITAVSSPTNDEILAFRDKVLETLLVSPKPIVGLDDMPAIDGDSLYEYSDERFAGKKKEV